MKLHRFENYKANPYDEEFPTVYKFTSWYDQLMEQLKYIAEKLELEFTSEIREIDYEIQREYYIFSRSNKSLEFFLEVLQDEIYIVETEDGGTYETIGGVEEVLSDILEKSNQDYENSKI